jgi:predicted transcriptional regulator
METENYGVILEGVTSIVAAYVANNRIQKENLPNLIIDTFNSLAHAGRAEPPVEELKPAVPVKRSVTPEYIICLENGKKFKSLKRHLRTEYNMTPQEYREKWGLPADYPMVAPNYALARSKLAKKSGLGQNRTPVVVAETPKLAVKPAKKTPAPMHAAKKTTGRRATASA